MIRLAIVTAALFCLSMAKGQPCGPMDGMNNYGGMGYLLEPTKLLCTPHDTTQVLHTLERSNIALLKVGFFNNQWYYYVKVIDHEEAEGYVLADAVYYLDQNMGCDTSDCLKVYHSFPNIGIGQMSNLVLAAPLAQGWELTKLHITESPAFKDVRLNYVNSIAGLDVYYGNLLQGGPYCGGHYGNDFLFAVDKNKQQMHLLYLDSFAGDEDGSGHQSSIYAYQPNRTKGYFYNADREYIDSIAVPEKLWPLHQNLLCIIKMDYETAIDSEGEPDINKYGFGTPALVKKETTWYTIKNNKLETVK